MIVIGFAGLARGGKTTAAQYLRDWCQEHDLDPVIYSFAAPMKRAAKRLGIDKNKNPELYRKTLQRWGESRRDPEFRPGVSGPDYWIERILVDLVDIQMKERYTYDHLDKYGWNSEFKEKVVIFDDMRYLNEVELIQDLGGTTIFVDGAERITDISSRWRLHESEKMAMLYTFGQLPDIFDYYITNNASEESLKQFIESLAPVWLDMETMS